MFVLFNLGGAIILCIMIYRMQRDKKLKVTLITGSATKVQSIVLSGRGLIVATIGWGISAMLLILSGLGLLFAYKNLEASLFLTLIGIACVVMTLLISSSLSEKLK